MKYLKVYVDFAEKVEALSEAECGRLFLAMMKYAESGAAPDLRGGERIIWPTARQMIDRERGSYDAICERNKNNITKRYQNLPVVASGNDRKEDTKTNTKKDTPNGVKKEAPRRFTPPTVEELNDFIRETELRMDANAFIDFYSSKGWKVGRASMKDWKAAARNWARRDAQDRKGKREAYHDKRQGEDMDKLMEDLGI